MVPANAYMCMYHKGSGCVSETRVVCVQSTMVTPLQINY